MGIITKEEFERTTQAIQKIQKEIREFIPIVKADLEHFSEDEFMHQICNNHIEYKIRQAKEGDFLYQCSYFNRKYFDAKNSKGKTLSEKPGIDVNIAGLAKFIIDCPHAEEHICRLKDFTYQEKDTKGDIKNL